jgi:hypothetical protein
MGMKWLPKGVGTQRTTAHTLRAAATDGMAAAHPLAQARRR